MSAEIKKVDVLSILSVSSLLIGDLPELPGYNGSILTIADGLHWLVLHGIGSTGKAMVNLGASQRIVAQVATHLEAQRVAALARIGGAA